MNDKRLNKDTIRKEGVSFTHVDVETAGGARALAEEIEKRTGAPSGGFNLMMLSRSRHGRPDTAVITLVDLDEKPMATAMLVQEDLELFIGVLRQVLNEMTMAN